MRLTWRVAVGGSKPDMSKLKINPGFCARLQADRQDRSDAKALQFCQLASR